VIPRPVILCGNSLGGTTAYSYAAKFPEDVRGLILVDTVAREHDDMLERPPRPRLLPAGPFSSLEEAIAALPPVLGSVLPRAMVRENLKPDDAGRLTWKFDYVGLQGGRERAHRNEPLWDYWRAVKCPTLILRGERSPACPEHLAQQAAQALSGATLVTIPDAGHFIALDQPSAFVEEVNRWLAFT
jgi:esterase